VVRHQFPRPAELSRLIAFRKPVWSATERRLRSALTIDDLRAIAKRRTPKGAFDYADGAAEAELSLGRARQAFRDIEFHPTILRDVSTVDTTREILGGPVALPFGIAPTGFTRLLHTEGEEAGAAAAAAAGIPFALSTVGTTSVERVAEVGAGGRHWFQLYMWTDRDRSMQLVERAANASSGPRFATGTSSRSAATGCTCSEPDFERHERAFRPRLRVGFASPEG